MPYLWHNGMCMTSSYVEDQNIGIVFICCCSHGSSTAFCSTNLKRDSLFEGWDFLGLDFHIVILQITQIGILSPFLTTFSILIVKLLMWNNGQFGGSVWKRFLILNSFVKLQNFFCDCSITFQMSCVTHNLHIFQTNSKTQNWCVLSSPACLNSVFCITVNQQQCLVFKCLFIQNIYNYNLLAWSVDLDCTSYCIRQCLFLLVNKVRSYRCFTMSLILL